MNARETAKADATLEFEATLDRSVPIDQWQASMRGFKTGYDAGRRDAMASLATARNMLADGCPFNDAWTDTNEIADPSPADWASEARTLDPSIRERLDLELARIRADLQRRMGVSFYDLGWRVVRTGPDSLYLYVASGGMSHTTSHALANAVNVGDLAKGERAEHEWRYEIL